MDVDEQSLRKYRTAIAATPVFVAYNANVDAMRHVDESLSDHFDPPGDSFPDKIEAQGDLSTALAQTMAEGEGNQLRMTDKVGAWLDETVEPDERRLGGQAGIAADILSSVGADPVLYTYLLSELQRSTFTTPEAIRYPVVQGTDIDYRPVANVTNAEQTKTNWIFEFNEGETFHGVEATDSHRFIAAARPERFNLETGGITEMADQIGRDVEGAFLAGYQSQKEQFADGSTAAEHVDSGLELIENLRSDNDIPIHVEYATTHNEPLRDAIREKIIPEVDVLGVDKRELRMLAQDEGIHEEGEDIDAIYERARALREAFDIPCIKLHATHYFMTVMENYQPAEHVHEGLDFASMVAATKATLGHVRSPGDLRIGANQDRSAAGIEATARLADRLGIGRDGVSIVQPSLVVQPNRVVPNPQSTVGIGDAVGATSFLLETALTRRDLFD